MLDRRTRGLQAYQAALEEAQDLGNLGTFIFDRRDRTYRLVGILARAYGRTEIPAFEIEDEVARVFHPDDRHEFTKLLDALRRFVPYEGEFRLFVDGEARWFQGRTKIVYGEDGSVTGMIGTTVDVTEKKLENERFRTLAYTDPETGMPNRTAFLEGADTDTGFGALLLVRFAWVGATLQRSPETRKHNARAIAGVLHRIVPPDMTINRYGDETVAISIPRSYDQAIVAALAERIRESFRQPVPVGNEILVTSPRIGVALAGERSRTLAELARRAEAALREAEKLEPHIAVFTVALERAHDRRATIDRHLRYAGTNGQLRAVYQPIFEIASGRVAAVEALMRWNCPGLGEVPPEEFIAIAEESGVIVQLGEWIMREACAQLKRWKDAGLPPVRMALNISERQAREPNFVTLVQAVCEEHGISPSQLELELTERAIIHPGGPGDRNLDALRKLGVRVAVDDFGTGYSALSYLASMPADTLKVDRTFVGPIAEATFQRDIAASVIELAHKRGLVVVGEGVETDDQLDCLRLMKCDEAQGYLFAYPMEPAAIATLLSS